MPNTVLALNPLQLITPSLPIGVSTVSVDTSILPLVVNADVNTTQVTVQYNGVTTTLTDYAVWTNPTTSVVYNQFATQISLVAGDAAIQITGSGAGEFRTLYTASIQFNLIYADSTYAVTIGPPTGLTVYRGQSSCTVEWAQPTFPGFLGVQVMYSTDPTGVTVPYAAFGGLINTVPSRTATVNVGTPATATVVTPISGVTSSSITTSSVLTQTVNYCSVAIPQSTINADIFYVLLSTVVQDPTTNLVYQSQQVGPLSCGFVNLQTVNPTDFLALQQVSDIASRMINSVTTALPNLDLTARSEIRDAIINPVALELANMSVREWFGRNCQSIDAISQIDDENGDGISDPVASSPKKQQIALAYGLNATDVQTFINSRFTVLGAQAGVAQGGPTTGVVDVTCFLYAPPIAAVSIPVGMVVSTSANSTTPSVSFATTGSAVIDPANPSAYYDSVHGWWSVTVPAQCQTAGSVGQVGAGTINQVTSGGPGGISVTNLLGSDNARDQQSNADFAAVIKNKQITGIDNNSRNGYLIQAQQAAGVSNPSVVAAGDLEMLRDWLPTIYDTKGNVVQAGRHIYGCVDIYGKSTSSSQQSEQVPFTYPSFNAEYGVYPTYLGVTPPTSAQIQQPNLTAIPFSIKNFTALTSSLYTVVELVVTGASGVLYLGTTHAQIDNVAGVLYLDPAEMVLNPQTGTSTVTNLTQIQGLLSSNATYYLMARGQAGLTHVPALQPVIAVDTISGPATGLVASSNITLSHINDFLLTGGSNNAGDTVSVTGTGTVPTLLTLALTGTTTPIDSNMSVPLVSGIPQNILAVRSQDASTLYAWGTDYTIVPSGAYRAYSLKLPPGSTISSSATVLVSYNKYYLNENLSFITDSLSMSGSAPSNLSMDGFVHNTWLPLSHSLATLVNDTALSGVSLTSRYIKVTRASDGLLMLEGRDFSLVVNDATGAASITRILSGRIPDGGIVAVSYYVTETFTVTTEYPTFVEQLIATLGTTQAASASVLVKSQVASPVDINLTVVLNSATAPSTVDGPIRTVIGIVLNNAKTSMAMASLTQQIMSITGVTNVPTPFQRCAKSDGSYDIGWVIPTSQGWNLVGTDPAFGVNPPNQIYISTTPVLQNSTIPSGGLPNAYVGMLYGGEAYRRAASVQDLLSSTVSSFYIVGTGDTYFSQTPTASNYIGNYLGKVLIANPTLANAIANPSLRSYFITFQVFGESGAKDITTSPTEYLSPGTVTINYITAS